MFRYSLLIFILAISFAGRAQNLEFTSTQADLQIQLYEKQTLDRSISIVDDNVVVTNYFGQDRDLQGKVQSTKEQQYLGLGMANWYQCQSNKNSTEIRFNIIVPNAPDRNRIVLQEVKGNLVTSSIDLYR